MSENNTKTPEVPKKHLSRAATFAGKLAIVIAAPLGLFVHAESTGVGPEPGSAKTVEVSDSKKDQPEVMVADAVIENKVEPVQAINVGEAIAPNPGYKGSTDVGIGDAVTLQRSPEEIPANPAEAAQNSNGEIPQPPK